MKSSSGNPYVSIVETLLSRRLRKKLSTTTSQHALSEVLMIREILSHRAKRATARKQTAT